MQPRFRSHFRDRSTVAAVAGGSTVCSHFNDSGFWLVRSLVGIDEKTTLKTWTIMETLVGVTGIIEVGAYGGTARYCRYGTCQI